MACIRAVIRPFLRYHNRRLVTFKASWAATAGVHSSNLQLLAARAARQSRPKTTTAIEKHPLPPTAEINKPEGYLDHLDVTTEEEEPTEQVDLTARQTEPDDTEQRQQELTEGQRLQRSTSLAAKLEEKSKNPQVLVLWDLDNKSPGARPADAAESLRNLASRYGEVTAIHAFANRHAFVQVNRIAPSRRNTSEDLDASYMMPWQWDQPFMPEEPEVLRCAVCGQKQKTTKLLEKHMEKLHLRERRKKLVHISQAKSTKRKEKLWQKYEPSLERYALASARMSNPESMGIKEDLRKAGVKVDLVSDAAEAADGALRRQFKKAIQNRVDWVFLVSDDKGFTSTLDKAKKQHIKTFVVGGKKSELGRSATSFMSWKQVQEEF